MMNRVFAEPTPGFVAHTAVSRLLREDSKALDSVGFLTEDLTPAATKVIEAYEKWPGSGEPNETGFNVENNTDKAFYLAIAKSPERSRRFGAAMRFMTQGSLYDINNLIRSWDWDSYDVKGMTMVDLGGGQGGVSCALARVTTDLKFVVQDLPGTVEEGDRILPTELRGRVKFMAHDFFEVQPVQGADIYFFRFILHNWSDKYATQILQNLMPALKPGARVLIYEFLPSEVTETEWSKKQGRNLDMIQALGWNSLERTVPDWKKLFADTDSRLKFRKTITPLGSTISLIEAIWKP
jgi:ubiquinone/menaquinone biosynthesis C-methylase UbiE